MTTIDFEPTGDVALDQLLYEAQCEIQATYDFLLPDEMVTGAIHKACDFFGLPEVPVIHSSGVCVWPQDTDTVWDDVFGFSRAQMMEMGIQGEDTLTLVYTHECAHRALQGVDGLDGKAEELACDYLSGVHAAMSGIDATGFEQALSQTMESDSHPSGSLRVEAIEYGQKAVEEMNALHIPLTLENCMELFDGFLDEHPEVKY